MTGVDSESRNAAGKLQENITTKRFVPVFKMTESQKCLAVNFCYCFKDDRRVLDSVFVMDVNIPLLQLECSSLHPSHSHGLKKLKRPLTPLSCCIDMCWRHVQSRQHRLLQTLQKLCQTVVCFYFLILLSGLRRNSKNQSRTL